VDRLFRAADFTTVSHLIKVKPRVPERRLSLRNGQAAPSQRPLLEDAQEGKA